MKQNQNKYWKETVDNMSLENQLELAKILEEKLKLNKKSINKSDNYNMDYSSQLALFLENYVSQSNNREAITKVQTILSKFKKLSLVSQNRVIEIIIPYLLHTINAIAKEDDINNCSKFGHMYSDNSWERREWTTYEPVVIDHQMCENYPIAHVKWERTCPNCGFTEEVLTEPEEVKAQREQEEKQAKIKKLQRELNELDKECK